MSRNLIFKNKLEEMFALIITTLTLTFCAVGLKATTVLIQSPGVVKVREGETVLIQCVLKSSNVRDTVDKFTVHWYNSRNKLNQEGIVLSLYVDGGVYRLWGFSDRFQLSRNVTSNSYSLTISDVKTTDSADYTCGIWGHLFGNGTRLNVTSADVPVLMQSPSLERVTEGHTARLWCTMTRARVEDTDVHWYRKLPEQDLEWVSTHEAGGRLAVGPGFKERFQPSRDTSNSSFILTVTDVKPSDSAVYYCTVWGDISGNGTQLVVTNPLDDPVLIQYPPFSRVLEGVTVQLQCALYNASVNDTDVHWYHQRPGNNSEWAMSHFVDGNVNKSSCISDRFKSYRNFTSNSYILSITNVSISDTAVYNCSVWNYIYGAGTQLNVTDANPPILIQSPSLEHVTESQSAWLECSMKNVAVGDTDVHWYRKLPGQDMEWVLTHEAGKSIRRRPGVTERFLPYRDTSNNSFILTVTDVVLNDSAVYYCTVWGDISGNGTQLIVIKPYETLSWKILGSITACVVVLVLLFCILIIAICYVKKWACFQHRLKPEGCSTEDLNTVSATVTAERQAKPQAATNVTVSEESEMYYADIQFLRQNTKGPTVTITEETTEYAVIKRA
ncbi:immunoglobulin gamma-1 heavy chain-like [Pristis pectinata]|uniref:immunoglobulin gamma-1 heavy chain-like n=1 Tax=Pristis pectinata TaxID=685728 RepID=UPI00223E7EFA|nr:immunoglobulin gamma-1 heavy chain-like [Pristis pectinata]